MVQKAQADAVESSNIVGYQSVTVEAGYSCFTATFKNVGDGELDLSALIPGKSDGSAFATSGRTGTCAGKIIINKLSSDGSYGTSFAYYSTKTPVGWYNVATGASVADGEVVFKQGEGFAMNNSLGESATIRTSGEVDLICKNAISSGFSIMGNAAPVDIDLTEIVCLKEDGTAFAVSGRTGTCAGKIIINTLGADGSYGTSYAYYSTKSPVGWYNVSTGVAATAGEVPLKAGTAFAVNNSLGSAAILQLPNPIAGE